ncbi:MAG: alkaline phosphatase D family protein, partial [Mycobacteriales bacterium]
MTALLLGPALRHVDSESATVWVETDGPCTVEVLAPGVRASEPTFGVAGHHYAMVIIEGLDAATSYEYEVRLDGEPVWPHPDSRHPPSRIRTLDPDRPFTLVFGSCRFATVTAVGNDSHMDFDALDAYALRMATIAPQAWPDAMLMVGDQVYADETTDETRKFIAARRDITVPPGSEVADFVEYTRLYLESWSDPDARWLMSTVPSSMIFDDHDVRDDWNTSHSWREEMQQTSWWEERITGGLMSYWIYQHLGNLSPAALAEDELYQRVRGARDAEPLLREFAQAADAEADGAKGARWSYRRDFGRNRLLVIDSRCGRIL